MIIVLGEILVDLFDNYQRIGGAPFNFAFHLQQLGFSVRFLTRIGDDPQGREIGKLLSRHHFDLDDVQVDEVHPTGTVRVVLDDHGVPRFDIREDVAYDYIDFEALTPIHGPDTRMIYFGTLAQRSDLAFERFDRLLSRKGPSTTAFCDLNLRPPHVRDDVIAASLDCADILKLNTDELHHVGVLSGGPSQEEALIAHLMRTHQIEMVILTRGSSGSTLFTESQRFDASPPPTGNVLDTVGAGDAFASVMAAGYLSSMPLDRALTAASYFAGQICQLPGAIPDAPSIYARLRKKMEGFMHD